MLVTLKLLHFGSMSMSLKVTLLGHVNYLFLWSSGVDVSKSEITPFRVDASISESNCLGSYELFLFLWNKC